MVYVCEEILELTSCDVIAMLDVALDPAKQKVKTKSGDDGAELSLSAKLPFVLTNGDESLKLTVSLETKPPAQLVK